MSDLKEPFPILEIGITGEGTNLTRSRENDPAAPKNAIAALSAIDADGNLRYVSVNSLGQQVFVQSEDAGANLSKSGLVAGVAASGSNNSVKTPVTVASITLIPGGSYKKLSFTAACMRTAEFKIVHRDNLTDKVLAYAITGPGQYSFAASIEALAFDAGLTGTQELRIVGTLHEQFVTDLRGSIAIVEEIEV